MFYLILYVVLDIISKYWQHTWNFRLLCIQLQQWETQPTSKWNITNVRLKRDRVVVCYVCTSIRCIYTHMYVHMCGVDHYNNCNLDNPVDNICFIPWNRSLEAGTKF